MPRPRIRIATRTSDLALWQAHYVRDRLTQLAEEPDVEIVHITTSGDRDQTSPLAQFGGTGAFTREVQHAVLEDRADIAVHSLKDLPTDSTAGLKLAAVPDRASTRDALLLPADAAALSSVSELPEDCRIGTSSPRRAAFLRRLRPDLVVDEIRGNVPTRIRKLDEGEFDAIVLAEAGLDRLGLAERISLLLQPPDFYAAVGQGALGIECRADDETTSNLLSEITCAETWHAVTAERSLLAALRAGCHAPVGVAALVQGDVLQLTGVLLDATGSQCLTHSAEAPCADAVQLGCEVAEQLLQAGGEDLLNPPDADK
jgi:hydroxymethylbilane synthase